MGSHRHDDRSSRMGNRNEPGRGGPGGGPSGSSGGPDRAEPGRVFDRNEDMGGSGWSGASGRGGMSYEGSGYAASNRGYGRERGDAGERGYGHEHGHEGGYPGDRRHDYGDPSGMHPDDRRFGHEPHERAYAGSYGGGGYGGGGYGGHERTDDGTFIQERGFGHVPGQRWSGGYGGDRDRDRDYGYRGAGPVGGSGFTGNDFGGRPLSDRSDVGGRDFGGLPRSRDRHFGAPADMSREQRHFGTAVDRGGRMGPPTGYGHQGSDMGVGMPYEDERGPHWGKGPKGYKRSDEKTREEVCEAIAHQGHIDASDVEVKVEDGIVVLSGTVPQRHHKRALEHLVEGVRGVHEVHNELRLARNTPPRNEDAGTTRAAQNANANVQKDNVDGNGHKNGKTARS